MGNKDLTIKLVAATKDNQIGYVIESKGNHNLLALLMVHSWATNELATVCKEQHISAEELTKLRKAVGTQDLN